MRNVQGAPMSFITMPIHWITRAALAPPSVGCLNCWKDWSAFWVAAGHYHQLALAHHSPGSPPGVVLAASPNCQVWAREHRSVWSFHVAEAASCKPADSGASWCSPGSVCWLLWWSAGQQQRWLEIAPDNVIYWQGEATEGASLHKRK